MRSAVGSPLDAVLIETGGRQCPSTELRSQCHRLVRACREAGLREGDAIAIVAPNCIEYIVTYLAALKLGCYLVPLNSHFAAAEIAHIVNDSEAKALVAHERFAAQISEAIEHSPSACPIRISLGSIAGFVNFESFLGASTPEAADAALRGTIMAYTSATTGRPKAVRRKLLPSTPHDLSGVFDGVRSDDVHLCSSRLYHTPVMLQTMFELRAGHRVVLFEGRWDALAVLEAIERNRVTTALMVPTMFVRLLKLPEAIRAKPDVSTLRYVVHTGAPCPIQVKRAMIAWWGPILWERYGSTEGGVTLVDSHDWLKYPGTVGRPEPGVDVRILDDHGREVPPGVIGDIYISARADQDFEYKDDEAKTRACRRGRFYTVGDVGYKNDAGFLFICDRKIDLIICGGVNIYPAEIEQVLTQHPAVFDCAVFAAPDEILGEVPKAIVQPAPGVTIDGMLRADIIQFLRLHLGSLKVPKQLEFRTALPRDPTGKIYKRLLKNEHAASPVALDGA